MCAKVHKSVRFRTRTDTHELNRAQPGHPDATADTAPLPACHGLSQTREYHLVHHNHQRRSLRTRKLVGSDLAAGDASSMPRVTQLPVDCKEGVLLVIYAGSQPTPLCTFDALPPPLLFVASCQDAAAARASIKVRDASAQSAAAVG